MKIALAQTKAAKGNIIANIQNHINWIEKAIDQECDLIIFPELSLTGYEPKLAKDLAFEFNDPRLEVFQKLSDQKKIIIGVGIPTKSKLGIQISLIMFLPNEPRLQYAKQYLHQDEKPYFVKGEEQLILNIDGFKIAPAICYESLQPEHIQNAIAKGVDIYLTSVAKSQMGIEKASPYYSKIANKYNLIVSMVNAVGTCDDFECAGKTSLWIKGTLINQLDDSNEGLLIHEI